MNSHRDKTPVPLNVTQTRHAKHRPTTVLNKAPPLQKQLSDSMLVY